jgi:hypothetical protein
MRRLGIRQWPYRKRTSAKKITHSLEVSLEDHAQPAVVCRQHSCFSVLLRGLV